MGGHSRIAVGVAAWLGGCVLWACASDGSPATDQADRALALRIRTREPGAKSGEFVVKEVSATWPAAKTAIIVCDMWNAHWCQGATRRVGELAPAMNETLKAARAKGVLIIHAPSSCMAAYKDHPARKRAQSAPHAANMPQRIESWCDRIPAEEKGVYPIDQSDGGCDDGPQCPQGSPWKSQIATLEIKDEDAISDSGAEIWNLLESRGITGVMLMGVHTNMCVLGRPFGLRNMAQHGKNVVLVRDLTDTMYNSRMWPFVSHFEGTNRVVEHVEKFVAGTILSTDLTGKPAFHFAADTRPRVVFVIGDDEYRTETTLPAFARSELEPAGLRCTFAIADPRKPNDFPGMAAIDDADLVIISTRRRAPAAGELERLKRHVAAGKPVIGLRTASHGFDARGGVPRGHLEWPSFDHDVLGGHYTGHYPAAEHPTIERGPSDKPHPLLTGVELPFVSQGSLYKTSPLATSAFPFLVGKIAGHPAEPVAWINLNTEARVFYTSLGHPDDFRNPAFRRLLSNAVFWCLGRPVESQARREEKVPLPFDRGQGPFPPSKALAQFQIPGDLALDQVLAEPVVRQPLAVSFDERGRMWVVEYLQYPHPAGLKLLSRDGVWRAVYDKTPLPPPHHVRGRDQITIHEDANGDGVYETHKTFVDGLNIATAAARGRGGVWILNPPYLLFYPDRDNNDVPDGDPEVHLQGFGLEDTHSVVNSLCFGPDGWLYAAQGSTVSGHVSRPGLDDGKQPVHSMGQLIWRYHPETRRYEIFAEGGGNAFGVEIDSKGRIYSGHNGGDVRGFHYVQGGYFQKGFNKHGPLSNPYSFGYFPAMKHHQAARFTHDFLIYEATALPERYRGRLLGVAPLLNHVMMSAIIPDGSSFQTHDLGPVVSTNDTWFRPVNIELGPDGAIYIADWYDGQVNHYRNHEGQVDPSSGRIYRLRARTAGFVKPVDLGRKTTPELITLLGDPNRWTRQTALRLLGDRVDRSAIADLRTRLTRETGPFALDLLWALNLSGGLDEPTAIQALKHPDPFVRLWTARLVCDERMVSRAVEAALVEMAGREPNIEARAQLACSAKRLPARDCLAIVKALLNHDEDVADVHQPLLSWWAVEAQVDSDPEAVLELLGETATWQRPMVQRAIVERLMRRFAAAGGRADLARCARLLAMAPGPDDIKRLMTGFEAAYAGRSAGALPDDLAAALARYSGQSLTLGLRQGKPGAIAEAIQILNDESTDRALRARLLRVLGESRQADCDPAVLKIACHSSDEELRTAAYAALANSSDPAIAQAVLATYANLSLDLKASVQGLLASRRTWAVTLLTAVEKGTVERETVSRETLEKLLLLGDPAIASRTTALFGAIKPATSAELRERINRLAATIRGGSGVPKPGKRIFDQKCLRCHTLFGKGGRVGPDLTTYRRDDIDNLLLNIVNPTAEIREGFSTLVVATTDGRVLTGVLVDQDKNVVVIRGDDGKETILARSLIEALRPSPRSLMPEGLLDDLNAQQARDLFAYLRGSQPLID